MKKIINLLVMSAGWTGVKREGEGESLEWGEVSLACLRVKTKNE